MNNQEIKPCACTAIRKANRAMLRYYEKAFSAGSLSLTQFSILRTVEREGPIPLSTLAEHLVMERTSLYRTITPLTERNALTLDIGSNKKIKIATITSYGKALIKEHEPEWEKAQNTFIEAIGPNQWQTISPILQSIPTLVSELS